MFVPKLDQSLSIGTLLTVLATASGLLYNWRKDRQLKRKEYADKVRRAAGLIVAKLDRWKELAMRLFEDIQPALTEADGMFVRGRDVIATRDYVWRELVAARAKSSQRILDEQIEIAYVDLYGYDPRIQELFVAVVGRLKTIDSDCYALLLNKTQTDVLSFEGDPEIESARLGNALRRSAGFIAGECRSLMERLIDAFRIEAMKLIKATDGEIIAKKVAIRAASDSLPKGLSPLLTPLLRPPLTKRLPCAGVIAQQNHRAIDTCTMWVVPELPWTVDWESLLRQNSDVPGGEPSCGSRGETPQEVTEVTSRNVTDDSTP